MDKDPLLAIIAVLSITALALGGAIYYIQSEGLDIPENSYGYSVYDMSGNVKTTVKDGQYLFYDSNSVESKDQWIYSWDFEGKTYTVKLDMTYQDVADARQSDIVRHIIADIYSGMDAEACIDFVTTDNSYLIELEKQLSVLYGKSDQVGYANFILKFCQSFEYELDSTFVVNNQSDIKMPASSYFFGEYEYWKLPLETLYDRSGDCEDTALLCTTLFEIAGMDAGVAMLPGHFISTVSLEGIEGSYYTGDMSKTKYYYCETTSSDFTIGEASMTNYANYFIPIHQTGDLYAFTTVFQKIDDGAPPTDGKTFVRDSGWVFLPERSGKA